MKVTLEEIKERERERMKGRGKMPIEKGKSNDGREGTQMSIIPWGVLPSAGGANEEDNFHHAFFLVFSLFSGTCSNSPLVIPVSDAIKTVWYMSVANLLAIKSLFTYNIGYYL